MESIDVSGLAQQIAARAMEEAKVIINRAFDGISGRTVTVGDLAGNEPARHRAAGRGRPVSDRTRRMVEALRGGMQNADVARKFDATPQFVSQLRTRYGLPKRGYRKAA